VGSRCYAWPVPFFARWLTTLLTTTTIMLSVRTPGVHAEKLSQLLSQLDNRDPEQRLLAVQGLARSEDPRAQRALMVSAQTDPDTRVRHAAAEAVRRINPLAYVGQLASAEPSPVKTAPSPRLRPRASRATLLALGLRADALRLDDSLGGNASAGLRVGWFEAELMLGFPAMTMAAQLRVLLTSYPRFTPLVLLGAAVSYNNGNDSPTGASASMFGGLGARYYWIPPIYTQLLLLVSWTPTEGPTVGDYPRSAYAAEDRAISLPLMLQTGLELWFGQ